jgi:hypothetical protein
MPAGRTPPRRNSRPGTRRRDAAHPVGRRCRTAPAWPVSPPTAR